MILSCFLTTLLLSSSATSYLTYEKNICGYFTGGNLDYIALSGKRTADSPYVSNIEILINGKIKITPPINQGYNPQIRLFDFEKPRCQLYLSLDTGGSGGFSNNYIYDFRNGMPTLVYDAGEQNKKSNKYSVSLQSNYTVLLENLSLRSKYSWSVVDTDAFYRDQLFTADGKPLLPNDDVFISDIVAGFPLYNPSLDRYELLTYRYISAVAMVYRLGTLVDRHTLESGNWQLISEKVEI